MSFQPKDYFDLENFRYHALFDGVTYVWEALSRIDDVIRTVAREWGDGPNIRGEVSSGAWVDDDVFIAAGAVVERGAYIQGPAVIGEGSFVRHGALLRGGCILGRHCIVGHASELKKVVMLDRAGAAHFNYVGDSILGHEVNMAAGAITSNFKSDGSVISVPHETGRIDTGMRKFGAIVGDGVKAGCNSVMSPGTLIGPGTHIYPGAVLRGVYDGDSIVKLRQQHEIVKRERRHE